MSNGETADEDLRQADLSHLAVNQMTPAQRAEIRRRYAEFINRLAKPPAVKPMPTPARPTSKWIPAMKAGR
jgi:hypothetical protein